VTGNYEIQPDRARNTVLDAMELLGQITFELTSLQSLVLPPTVFAQIGQTPAASTARWKQQLLQTFFSLVRLLSEYNDRVTRSADAYQRGDGAVTDTYRNMLGAPDLSHQPPTA
jgi:hypothetical protein